MTNKIIKDLVRQAVTQCGEEFTVMDVMDLMPRNKHRPSSREVAAIVKGLDNVENIGRCTVIVNEYLKPVKQNLYRIVTD